MSATTVRPRHEDGCSSAQPENVGIVNDPSRNGARCRTIADGAAATRGGANRAPTHARIAGARDEAELFGDRGKGRRARRRGRMIMSARRRPHSCCSPSINRPARLYRVTEGEPDAARQRAVAQAVAADGFALLSRAGTRTSTLRGRRERARGLRLRKTSRARGATPRHHFEETGGARRHAGGTTPISTALAPSPPRPTRSRPRFRPFRRPQFRRG